MELYQIENGRVTGPLTPDAGLPDGGYAWLDIVYDESGELADRVHALTGVRIYDDHLEDVKNPGHPSSFDSTDPYELIVFRGLSPAASGTERITTVPMFLFNFDRLLVTVRHPEAPAVQQVKGRFLGHSTKCPQNPDELMHRLLSAMVDRYLDLRQPLTRRLEAMQRALLDPRKPFQDWARLLEGRSDLRRLQNLCEEQHDAVQEWRDMRLGEIGERLQVRFHDLVEHIERVQRHARHAEQQAESAVQLYFAAMANRTSEVMRTLTILTAVFMPLTVITGVFGMNFDFIPGLHDQRGFWLSIVAMAVVVVAMLLYFRTRRWL
jgi:magnesium/cobalt transport protein CorA